MISVMNKFRRLCLLTLILFLISVHGLAFAVDINSIKELKRYKFEYKKDNNNDGDPDAFYYKYEKRNKECLMEDTDYDGELDTVTYYENGELVKTEMDVDKDGELDYRYWYESKKVDKIKKQSE